MLEQQRLPSSTGTHSLRRSISTIGRQAIKKVSQYLKNAFTMTSMVASLEVVASTFEG